MFEQSQYIGVPTKYQRKELINANMNESFLKCMLQNVWFVISKSDFTKEHQNYTWSKIAIAKYEHLKVLLQCKCVHWKFYKSNWRYELFFEKNLAKY